MISVDSLSSLSFAAKDISDTEEPLFNYASWEKYRQKVNHPSLVLKTKQQATAKANIAKFEWAQNYAENLESTARHFLEYAEEKVLSNLIEETTPGEILFTPCPACRDQGKPVHPHGLWKWQIEKHSELECTVCGTVFPNARYPEDISYSTTWGKPQKLTFYSGDTFQIFGFPKGRPSFAGNLRARLVDWYSEYARFLGETYLLTGKAEFALACKKILIRLANCYPNWLVHAGYGEYADMDPRVAAQNIDKLPFPEITPEPNQPDHKLWTGYWTAGRARGVGLESDFTMKVVEAYDLTCDVVTPDGPVYSQEDKLLIEKDLLLESTVLLVCDKKINNKSVRNRTAAGLAGISLGHPELFRFGLEGFVRTLNEWFLPDGTTSESPVYGLMTLKGIWAFAEAAKGYSDPEGYVGIDGKRIDNFDPYQMPSYQRVFEGIINGLQGDLTFPAYADSFLDFKITASYLDLISANYPENSQYRALLKEMCGQDLSLPSGPAHDFFFKTPLEHFDIKMGSLIQDRAIPADILTSFSLFFREPDRIDELNVTFTLPDICPDHLKIGHLRTGSDGRESLLTLSASDWGVHHHRDSLNLYYWKNGVEILSDFGYLWDHPDKLKTVRTIAHNTVLINEKDQQSAERGGEFQFFEVSDRVKVMRAASNAYKETSIYNRTSALIDHGNGDNYAIDFFEVEGGEIQDYVFHLSHLKNKIENANFRSTSETAVYDLSEIQSANPRDVWNISWELSPEITARAWIIPLGERIFIGNGWGQREWTNTDIGRTVPYIVRRTEGTGKKRFITIFTGDDKGATFIKKVNLSADSQLVEITTPHGLDLVGSFLQPQKIEFRKGKLQINDTGRFFASIGDRDGRRKKIIVP